MVNINREPINKKSNAEDDAAKLPADVAIPFKHTTEYSSLNLSEAQKHWDAISFDSGIVAIPHDETKAIQIPPAQPFQWDTSKGLYFEWISQPALSGMHECFLGNFIMGLTQSYRNQSSSPLWKLIIT